MKRREFASLLASGVPAATARCLPYTCPVPKCTLGAPNPEEESHACAEAQDHA
jgi:hypothetical protein